MGNRIVIIHGAHYLQSKSKFGKFLIGKFYGFFNVKPSYATKKKWLAKINAREEDVSYLEWSGNIFSEDVSQAVDDLAEEISNGGEVVVISSSIGTHIALQATRKTKKIKKIISLCGVFSYVNSDIEFIDIVSRRDSFQSFFRFLFNPFGRHLQSLKIILPGLRHDGFQKDPIIKRGYFKSKRVSDLVNEFL